MDNDLAQKAISYALAGSWNKAIEVNTKILEADPQNVDALNRLARAYAELGNLGKARHTAKKVIAIDPFNPIALKALEKWKGLKKGETLVSGTSKADMFLEEPGKTKIVPLLNLGDNKLLSKLDSGDEVVLKTHGHKACVVTKTGKYIGKLPDDLSARLKKLITYGNEYQVLIKSTDKNDVKVFIREVKRSKKLSDIPSFSTEKIEYISFTPPELVHKRQDLELEGEEEEQ